MARRAEPTDFMLANCRNTRSSSLTKSERGVVRQQASTLLFCLCRSRLVQADHTPTSSVRKDTLVPMCIV